MSGDVCFAVYGAEFTPEEFRKRLCLDEDASLWDAYYAALTRQTSEDIRHYEFHDLNDGSYVYVGVAPDSMLDDETKLQFQARVQRVLRAVLGEPLKFSYYVDTY